MAPQRPAQVYLDHNATAWPLPEAAAAAAAWLQAPPGNPSSVHGFGRRARAAVERARAQVAAALGAAPREITFTSGATEGLHLAIGGLCAPGARAVRSAVEHPAVAGAFEAARLQGSIAAVDAQGRLSVAAVEGALRPDTELLAVMRAQNELGTLYPVAELAAAARGRAPGVRVVCDAVQAWGKIPLDVRALGADAVVVSGHKIGAPPGVGAVWLRPGLATRPTQGGGPQERGRRGGTENVAGIVGLGVAAAAIPARLAAMPAVARRRDRLLAGLQAQFGATLRVHGAAEARLPNTLAFRLVGVPGDVLLAALDLEGIALSSGSACASGAVTASPVLRALGLSDDEARGGLRASLGPETTDDEIERVLAVLPALAQRARVAA